MTEEEAREIRRISDEGDDLKAEGRVFRKKWVIRANVLRGQHEKAERGLLGLAVGRTLMTFARYVSVAWFER